MSELPENRKPLLWKDMPFSARPKAHPSTERLEIEKLKERVAELETCIAKADALADVCMSVDGYLTRLQTPGTEPLNSVNGSTNKRDRSHFTAQVRNEAREQWAALGNALAAYREGSDT